MFGSSDRQSFDPDFTNMADDEDPKSGGLTEASSLEVHKNLNVNGESHVDCEDGADDEEPNDLIKIVIKPVPA
jgi:hypothetical protein